MNHFLFLLSFLFLISACGKNPNEVEGAKQEALTVSSIQNSYPSVTGFSVEHLDQDPLSRSELKTAPLMFSAKPFALTQWIVENVFFRYHYEENGYENFNKLNRLQNGVVLPLQQPFYDYLQKNNQYPHITLQVELGSESQLYDYHVGFVSMKNLEILPRKIKLYSLNQRIMKTEVLSVDEMNQFLKSDFQPVIFWEKSQRSRMSVYVVEEGDVRTVELEGVEKRDLLSILNTNLQVVNFNEYADKEDILSWNPHQDFWICFPCDANKIGSFGSAYLIKTNVASLIKSNRKPNVFTTRYDLDKQFLVSNLKPFDQVQLSLKFIQRIPVATIPRGVSGSSIGRDCINTSTTLSSKDEIASRPSGYLNSTYIEWYGLVMPLRDFFSQKNIVYSQNDDFEIEFSLELEEMTNLRIFNETQNELRDVVFHASEMICGDRIMHQWPMRVETHEAKTYFEMRMSVNGLSR